ncbi:glycosyltransferase family 39 protein [Galbibacter sp. PAP.153]|uniref:ArnT family glycosyltransferase n=1 Tax=Galbibacter sp. PAP.153 TaxID=3104623 RepID=UPI00300826FA
MAKKPLFIVIVFCVIKLTLHLIADYNSGYQGDELLHIETGNHLAFGFMEFPPLIALLAFLQNLLQSSSVFVNHIFIHLAAISIMIMVSKIVLELGGKAKAVFLVLLCIIIAPGFERSQQLFQPVVFSQFFWVLNFYFLLKYVCYLKRRHLWFLTLGTALAFLTKYDAVFFIFGVLSLLIFKTTRQALYRHKFWWHILVFILVISPNIIWQYKNDFPVLKMFDRLYQTQLDQLEPIPVLTRFIISLNPLTLLVWGVGFIFMFHAQMRKYRPAVLSILLSVVLLSLSQGKGYYFYPVLLTILPFGGVFWENVILTKRKWVIYPLTLFLCLGIFLIPFGMPVFSLKHYLKKTYPYEKKEVTGGRYAVRFEERFSNEKWSKTLKALKQVYDSLPEMEKKSALIWGKHYRQAGAVSLYGKEYGLPNAFSLHGSFYSWLPSGEMPLTTIALRDGDLNGKDFYERYFEEIIPVKSVYNPYADEKEKLYQTIFICKSPKQTFDELKEQFQDRIFE